MTKICIGCFFFVLTLLACGREEDCIYTMEDLCLKEEYLLGAWEVDQYFAPDDEGYIITIRKSRIEFFSDGTSFSTFIDSPNRPKIDSSYYALECRDEKCRLELDVFFYDPDRCCSSPSTNNIFIYKSEDQFELHRRMDTILYDPTKLQVGQPLSDYLYILTRQ